MTDQIRGSRLSLIGLLLLIPAAMFALSACGPFGDSDEDKIKDVIERGLTDDDPDFCEDGVTDNALEEEHPTATDEDERIEECKEEREDGDPADDVEVSDVEVDGDEATADVKIEGGDADGTELTLDLKKEDGDWKIDGAEAADGESTTGTTGFTETGFTDTVPTETTTFPTTTSATDQREIFEQALRQQLIDEQDFTTSQADCVIEFLQRKVTDAEFDSLLEDLTAGGEPEIFRSAGRKCASA